MAIDEVMRAENLVGMERKALVQERKSRPVLFWAGIGTAALLLTAYMWARWIASGPENTSVGPTHVPAYMAINMRAQEIIGVILLVFCIWKLVITPIRRDGHISWDGMVFIAAPTVWACQDLIMSWSYPMALYNSYWLNLGSWFNYFPGWNWENAGRMAEPFVWASTWYIYGICLFMILANWVMRHAKRRWPHMGRLGMFGVAFVFSLWIDVIFEGLYLLGGNYVFVDPKGPVLFKGHYFQYPMVEGLIIGTIWGGYACLRYYRDDKGRSFAERGIDEVRVGRKGKTFLRWLAVVGVIQVGYFGFNVLWLPFSLQGKDWPADIAKRSYFTNGLCGPGSEGVKAKDIEKNPGTNYACTTPGHRGQPHISPTGEVLLPPGGKMPASVPQAP